MLRASNEELRQAAIYGLGGLRQEAYLEHLDCLLNSAMASDRIAVVSSIANLAYEVPQSQRQRPIQWSPAGRERWVERMILALRDELAAVRRPAAIALQYLNDPRALSALRDASQAESDVNVKHFIEEATVSLQSVHDEQNT